MFDEQGLCRLPGGTLPARPSIKAKTVLNKFGEFFCQKKKKSLKNAGTGTIRWSSERTTGQEAPFAFRFGGDSQTGHVL